MKKNAALALVAVVSLALTACSTDKEAQAARYARHEADLVTAQRNAAVDCSGTAQCDAAWVQTKRYIELHSNTSITRADAFAIDTDVPSSSGDVAFSATRVAKGTSGGATLTLFAQCRAMYGANDEKGSDYDECAEKIIKTQNGYVAFLNSHVTGQ
ncbi:hypothetical protein [Paraburkholderia rhizosphaerae]|uniref:Lipoprotein n=1 Tax=Paraburkholderia rhizosphaerae TaxID=480658 RepID=A0A4R8LJ86_9BURK|nr:hypothetical protein [Paraburkholderia rhizosphaerae]TDY43851.1 hypothetical protein BX592_11752 [Paraburkholderia rhizosphaerae]